MKNHHHIVRQHEQQNTLVLASGEKISKHLKNT